MLPLSKTPSQAEREFREWASFHSGDLFVNLVLYADESGNHDQTGARPGSQEATVAGIVGPVDALADFSRRWQSTLRKYGAPYFHFTEWKKARKTVSEGKGEWAKKGRNPFMEWNLPDFDAFLVDLAKIAGSGDLLPVINGVFTSEFHRLKKDGDLPASANPYEHCVDEFFRLVPTSIMAIKPTWRRKAVSFVFDQSDDHLWTGAITRIFHTHKPLNSTWGGLSFEDKKLPPNLPLQAADMVAFRARQMTHHWADDRLTVEILDKHLFNALYGHLKKHDAEVFSAYLSGQFDRH